MGDKGRQESVRPQEADQIVRQNMVYALKRHVHDARLERVMQDYATGQIRTVKEALDRYEGGA